MDDDGALTGVLPKLEVLAPARLGPRPSQKDQPSQTLHLSVVLVLLVVLVAPMAMLANRRTVRHWNSTIPRGKSLGRRTVRWVPR